MIRSSIAWSVGLSTLVLIAWLAHFFQEHTTGGIGRRETSITGFSQKETNMHLSTAGPKATRRRPFDEKGI